MDVKIESSWKSKLQEEFHKDYFIQLTGFVREEYSQYKVYPPAGQIFNAFEHCPFDLIKVVIIGQDPYHGPGQAHGLCFSVSDAVTKPPSLVNIFQEINQDLGISVPIGGSLVRWADQGVLLLNSVLTVRARQAGSHQKKGWEEFTDAVIRCISSEKDNVVFLCWGAYAQCKSEVIDRSKHHILESPHPSPFSAHRGFLGNKHFSKTNEFLRSKGLTKIQW